MAVWLGGLAALLIALVRGTDGIGRDGRTAVLPDGVRLRVRTGRRPGSTSPGGRSGSWCALGHTAYGRLLLVKIGAGGRDRWAWRGSPGGGRGGWRNRLSGSRRRRTRLTHEPAATRGRARTPWPSPRQAPRTRARRRTRPGYDDRIRRLRRRPCARRSSPGSGSRWTGRRSARTRDGDPARAGLRRSVLAEAAIAVVVLAVTTVLTRHPAGRGRPKRTPALGGAHPPRRRPAAAGCSLASIPFDTGGPKGKGSVGRPPSPARVGPDELHLTLNDPAGARWTCPRSTPPSPWRPRRSARCRCGCSTPAPGTGPPPALQLPMAGRWQLAVTVRTDAIDEVTVTRNERERIELTARTGRSGRTASGCCPARAARHRAAPPVGGRARPAGRAAALGARRRRRPTRPRPRADVGRRSTRSPSTATPPGRDHHAGAGPRSPGRLRPGAGRRAARTRRR